MVANVVQILLVFLVALVVMVAGWSLVGDDPLARQAVVWVANVAMLLSIWIGLRVRGQTWEHLGLSFRFGGLRALVRSVAQSIVVLVAALVAFVAASVLTSRFAQVRDRARECEHGLLRVPAGQPAHAAAGPRHGVSGVVVR